MIGLSSIAKATCFLSPVTSPSTTFFLLAVFASFLIDFLVGDFLVGDFLAGDFLAGDLITLLATGSPAFFAVFTFLDLDFLVAGFDFFVTFNAGCSTSLSDEEEVDVSDVVTEEASLPSSEI